MLLFKNYYAHYMCIPTYRLQYRNSFYIRNYDESSKHDYGHTLSLSTSNTTLRAYKVGKEYIPIPCHTLKELRDIINTSTTF